MHFTDDRPLHGETAMRAEELLSELEFMTVDYDDVSTNDKVDMLVGNLGVSEEQARRFVEGRA